MLETWLVIKLFKKYNILLCFDLEKKWKPTNRRKMANKIAKNEVFSMQLFKEDIFLKIYIRFS